MLDIALPDRPLDGISLLPLIEGKMTERSQPIGFWSRSQRSLVGDRYKLYSPDDGQTWELYDLVRDPGETTNLAEAHPERVAQMRAVLDKWIASCEASDRGDDY